MERLENSLRCKEAFKLRKTVYKQRPMGKLETKIAEFLVKSGVAHHRRWPIKLGKDKPAKRYIVSFYLPKQNIALDMVEDGYDESLYAVHRRKVSIWSFGSYPRPIAAIIPVNVNLGWREVKKQLAFITS